MKETNMEHFRSEIEEILNRLDYNLPAVVNGKPIACRGTSCDVCDLDGKGVRCHIGFMQWLMSEYKEEPVLTEREKHFVECVEDGWITRYKDDALVWWSAKPTYRNNGEWHCECRGGFELDVIKEFIFGKLFPFITWEDEEPWSIEQLRKLKVKDDE